MGTKGRTLSSPYLEPHSRYKELKINTGKHTSKMDLEVTMGLKSIDLASIKAGLFRLGGLARSLDYVQDVEYSSWLRLLAGKP